MPAARESCFVANDEGSGWPAASRGNASDARAGLFRRAAASRELREFYIANKIVIMPTFNDSNDRVALNTVAGLFPDREVVGIACRDLVLGLGTLHCMTQQQPLLRRIGFHSGSRLIVWTENSDTILVPKGGLMFAAQVPTQRTVGIWFESHASSPGFSLA